MTKQELQESVLELLLDDEQVLLADGFEDAFLGIQKPCDKPPHAVYDRNKCIEILMEQGMEADEAEEYFSFNVEGSKYDDVEMPAFILTL